MNVELVLPPAELRDWRQKAEDQEFFDRGERIILVDGERWGRTIVRWHGCNGTSTSFRQDGGEEIGRTSKYGYFHAVTVRSSGRRPWHDKGEWKSTDQLVLDKVHELIAEKKLRPPAVVKAEAEAARARWRQQQAEREQREAAEFRVKALEAAGYTGEPNDPESVALVERIVEAMKWAQAQ